MTLGKKVVFAATAALAFSISAVFSPSKTSTLVKSVTSGSELCAKAGVTKERPTWVL